MDVIYVDSLFFLNFIIDYLLLLITARVCSLRLHRWRYLLGALLGAGYALCSVLPGMGFLSSGVMKIALGAAMALVAYGGERRLLMCAVAFMAVSAAFGGAVWGASMLSGSIPTASSPLRVSLRVLLLSFAVCYAAVALVFRNQGKRVERSLTTLTVEMCGRLAVIKALKDNGNELIDPVTGAPVIVASAGAVLPLLPKGAETGLRSGGALELFESLSRFSELSGRIRLIPFSSVGTPGGLITAFRPDAIVVDGEARYDALIAISATELCPDGQYAAVISA